MGDDKIEEILAGAGPAAKRGILDGLVFRLVSDLNEAEKRDLLHTVLSGRKESRQLSSMVEYWIKECTDSGVNPLEMSKEVVSIVSHSYEMATYSTPELRGIFNDWMEEIEREVLTYLQGREKVDHIEVADHFRLKPESAIFILSKLAREGKIKMEASGKGEVTRPDNYTGWIETKLR